MSTKPNTLKIAIIQRLLSHFRISLFQALARRDDINLTVIVSDPGISKGRTNDLGFSLVNLPALPVRFSWGLKKYFIPVTRAIVREILNTRYDIVVTEGTTNIVNNLLTYPACRLAGTSFVWWGAGRRRQAPPNILRRIADPGIAWIIRRADACIAYSTVACDYFVGRGARPKAVFVAHNTLDVTPALKCEHDYSQQIADIKHALLLDGHKIILFVGSVERRKKIENLILAFKKLRKKDKLPSALLIVGDGPHCQFLQSWCKTNRLDSRVHFLGKIVDEVDIYFSMCDVFVLPSEGGLALNQAMAHCKPVIATSADGTEVDLIRDGWNGYIVAEDNIDALSLAIFRVIRDPARQNRMGCRSADLMREKFTLEHMVEKFVEALHYCKASQM